MIQRTIRWTVPLAALLLGVAAGAGGEHVVNQKDKAFYPKKVTARVGDKVRFTNDDPFAHNVFSLSDTKSFDLGSYGQGQARSVLLDKAGVVEVECAVHPDMKMLIEVRQ